MMGNDEDGDRNRTVDQERVQWYGEGGGVDAHSMVSRQGRRRQ